jgi:hypothetical protein
LYVFKTYDLKKMKRLSATASGTTTAHRGNTRSDLGYPARGNVVLLGLKATNASAERDVVYRTSYHTSGCKLGYLAYINRRGSASTAGGEGVYGMVVYRFAKVLEYLVVEVGGSICPFARRKSVMRGSVRINGYIVKTGISKCTKAGRHVLPNNLFFLDHQDPEKTINN